MGLVDTPSIGFPTSTVEDDNDAEASDDARAAEASKSSAFSLELPSVWRSSVPVSVTLSTPVAQPVARNVMSAILLRYIGRLQYGGFENALMAASPT
jgi:hypothetical protein